jgi:hypothetical protein
MDASAVDAAMSALMAAIGTYGRDVLTRVEKVAADDTVGLGLKLLGRFKRAKQPALEEAVLDAADNPGDEDFEAGLRAQLKKAMNKDPELAADVTRLLREGGVSVIATGERSVAVAHNAGIISVGDNADNRIEK